MYYYPSSLIHVSVWPESTVLLLVIQVPAKSYLVMPLHRLSQVWNCSFRGCGEDDQGQGQQTSCLAAWLLCASFLFTLKLCVQPLSFPSPCRRTWIRGKVKNTSSKLRWLEAAWRFRKSTGPGNQREMAWVLALPLTKAGPWDYPLISEPAFTHPSDESNRNTTTHNFYMLKWKIRVKRSPQCLVPRKRYPKMNSF